MKTWSHYAFIVDDKILNISPFGIEGKQGAETYGRAVYGENCEVVDVTNYRLEPDYRYHDGAFWHVNYDEATDTETETKIEPVPSEEDRIEAVESTSASNASSIESNTTAIDDILVMLLDDTSATEVTE